MANMTKTTLYPNLWELCSFVAEVVGVGAKRAVYDNHKTFYECGYMPYCRRDEKAFCAVDIVKNLIAKAQKRGKIGLFREYYKPLNYMGIMVPHSNESYLESAGDLIKFYLLFVRTHERKKRLDKHDLGIIYYNVELRIKNACENELAWFGEKWGRYEAEVFGEYLEWCEGQTARKNFIEVVVWFLGESYREKCETHYDERFQKSVYLYGDIKALLEKDLKNWDVEDKKKAFAVPFCGMNPECRNELYSLFFEKITREYRAISNCGRKHPNLIIDQYTELGYTFNWQCAPVINEMSKQVLRMDSDNKEVDSLVAKFKSLEIPKEIDELTDADVFKSVEDDLKNKIKVKGMGDLIRSNVALLMGNIPKNIAKQDPIAEINRELDDLENNSQEAKFAWQVISRQFPILGATGYICEKKWKPYIPYIRQVVSKPYFLIFLKFGIKVLNVLSKFQKIPEILGK